MAPAKPAKNISLRVPRHNAQRINIKLSTEVENQAKLQHVLVDTAQPSSRLAQAIESASDWNSLLMTARAERGPQWDVGTQQFLVDKYSDLYYDPTPLLETIRKLTEDENGPESASQGQQQQQQQHRDHHHQQQSHHSQHQHPQHQPFQTSLPSRHQTPMRERDYGMSQHMPRDQSPHRHPGGGSTPGNYPYPPGMNMRGPSSGGYPGGGPSSGSPFNPSANRYMQGDPSTPIRGGSGMGISSPMGGDGMRPNMGGGGMGIGGMGGGSMGGGSMGGGGMGGGGIGGGGMGSGSMGGGGMGGGGMGGGMGSMGGGGLGNLG
ncbi:hypothetical protein CVT25_005912, partial [Psilocybe cyanescens]